MSPPSPASSSSSSSEAFAIHTSLLFSPISKTFLHNISLLVSPSTGLVVSVSARASAALPSPLPLADVDLTQLVVLPGLVDAHTHIFLHAYAETSAYFQMTHESPVERILRAANHAHDALMAGYTTYRDLGTEGMGDADIGLRDAINRGLVPGPRLLVATEAIASSGGYALRSENGGIGISTGSGSGRTTTTTGTLLPRLSDEADGVEGVRAAVRRRLGAGADIVKFYADQEKRNARAPEDNAWPGSLPLKFPLSFGDDKPRHHLLFSEDEMRAMVDEAHESECPVAAHASSSAAVIRAARAGVDTVEHGQEATDEALDVMREQSTIFVPTLAVMEEEVPQHAIAAIYQNTYKAYKAGIKLACGGDIGPVPHGQNVRELELMLGAGVPLEEVLTAATLHGWNACGGAWCGRRFGWLAEGCAADLIGLRGDPREDVGALRRVDFVMKDGRVWKKEGKRVD